MKILFCFCAMLFLAFLSCDSDKGIEPLKSAIEGTVTFKGEWPTPPAEVRLVAAKKFPPSDINDLELGESIPVDVTTFKYAYYLEPATYKLIGVIWRTSENAWDFASICGVYFSGSDSLLPGQVALNDKDTHVTGIDFVVNRSKARKAANSKITGSINFEGSWPEALSSAMIVASTRNPLSETFTLLDLNIGTVIPRGTSSIAYSINAAPATYRAISILFFKNNQPLSVDDLYYSQNIGGLVIKDIVVGANETVAGPDFNIQIGPVLSGIQGTVTFKGEWPDVAEEVRLVAATTFPPEFEEIIIGELIPSAVDKYEYNFKLKPGTYKLVGVAWRAQGTVWDLLSICGFHLTGTDSLAPALVIIQTDTSKVKNINIDVNRTKARKITNTNITGSIVFNGNWPSGVTEARVIASTKFSILPVQLPTLLDLGFSESITPGTKTYKYEIKAFPATFVATAVVFFKEGQLLSVNDIFYSSQVGGLNLTPYEVKENATVVGPDFTIQF